MKSYIKCLVVIGFFTLFLGLDKNIKAAEFIPEGYTSINFSHQDYNLESNNWSKITLFDFFESKEQKEAMKNSRLKIRILNDYTNVLMDFSTKSSFEPVIELLNGNSAKVSPSFTWENNLDSYLINPIITQSYFEFTPRQAFSEFKLILGYNENLESKFFNEEIKICYNIRAVQGQEVENNAEMYYISNYDNPATVEEILNKVKAFDEVDGDVTSRITIEKNDYFKNDFTVDNRKKLGLHKMVLKVSDLSNNTSFLNIFVKVIDVTSPVISGPVNIEVSVEEFLTNEQIIDKFTASDNYDVNVNIGFSIESNEYNVQTKRTLGQKNCVIKVIDCNNNISTKSVFINVVDDIKPTIVGPKEIVQNILEVKTLTEILAGFTANDNVDGNLSKNIIIKEENYTSNINKVGTYDILLEVEDYSKNKNTFSFNIKIIDNTPPKFEVSNDFFSKSTFDLLTIDEIVEFLEKLGKIESFQSYDILMDEYSNNAKIPGEYKIKFCFKNEKNEELIYNINVLVYEENTNINRHNKNMDQTKKQVIVFVFMSAFLLGGFLLIKKKRKSSIRK